MIMMDKPNHDMEEEDLEIMLLESDVRGYLYKPQYSEEQVKVKVILFI